MPRDFRLYLDDILEAIHQIRTYYIEWSATLDMLAGIEEKEGI